MLKLCPNPTFEAEVKITVPGQPAPESVFITFKHFDKSAMSELVEKAKDMDDITAVSTVVMGWREIDQPFTAENLALLLKNFPASAGEIMRVFYRESLESRAKN